MKLLMVFVIATTAIYNTESSDISVDVFGNDFTGFFPGLYRLKREAIIEESDDSNESNEESHNSYSELLNLIKNALSISKDQITEVVKNSKGDARILAGELNSLLKTQVYKIDHENYLSINANYFQEVILTQIKQILDYVPVNNEILRRIVEQLIEDQLWKLEEFLNNLTVPIKELSTVPSRFKRDVNTKAGIENIVENIIAPIRKAIVDFFTGVKENLNNVTIRVQERLEGFKRNVTETDGFLAKIINPAINQLVDRVNKTVTSVHDYSVTFIDSFLSRLLGELGENTDGDIEEVESAMFIDLAESDWWYRQNETSLNFMEVAESYNTDVNRAESNFLVDAVKELLEAVRSFLKGLISAGMKQIDQATNKMFTPAIEFVQAILNWLVDLIKIPG